MKRISHQLTFLIFSVFIIAGCQKEYSVETGATPVGGTAIFTFDGGSGDCTGAIISGSYTAGVAVSSANTVTLSIKVDSVGTYIVSTNTVTGVKFSGTGSFTTKGMQTITLVASGTPAGSGTFNFTPGTTGCTFNVTVASGNGGSSGTASFTYAGGTANCTGAILAGTYNTGTALTSANTVKLQVTVDTIGSYTVSTAAVNGIAFTGSGTFTATGVQTIILIGTGNPASAGTFDFTPGTNAYKFSVTVADGNVVSDCKTCIYAPTCIGSMYNYEINFGGSISTRVQKIISQTDTLVSGLTYKKTLVNYEDGSGNMTSSGYSYINCNNGESTAFAYNLTGLAGSTISFIKSTLLKANTAIGGTWSETIPNQVGQDVINTYTMKEKGITRTVLGVTFNDVLHIELTQQINIGGMNVDAGVSQYYFAKGVGLIETTNESFGITNTQLLKDYFIP